MNKETGDTWLLVSTQSDYAWQKMNRTFNLHDTIPEGYEGDVYQITMSGIAAKGTYLTNTLTGVTWVLYSDADTGELFWGTMYFLE